MAHIMQKRTILHSKWTLLKSCCFFVISLRSIINLAHDFKSPLLDIEITISTLFGKKPTKVDFSLLMPHSVSLEPQKNDYFYIDKWTFKVMCEVYYRAKRDKKEAT